jgi:hypothetical protein
MADDAEMTLIPSNTEPATGSAAAEPPEARHDQHLRTIQEKTAFCRGNGGVFQNPRRRARINGRLRFSGGDAQGLSGYIGQRRRGGGATPGDCGCFAIAKSNVAGFEYQCGGGTWRRKSSSAAFIAAMVCAA